MSHYAMVACGGERTRLSGATAGRLGGSPALSSLRGTSEVPGDKLGNLEVEPQIYHLETLARLSDPGLTVEGESGR